MKKVRKYAPFLAGLSAIAMLCAPAALSAGKPAEKTAGPTVTAHRGGAMLRPENSMPAFRHAVDLGVEILEFDMMMTADDQIAIHHDANVNPDFCTPAEGSDVVAGPVRQLTLAQMQQFDCGAKVRPQYAGEKFVPVPGAGIPTLDEVLREFRGGDTLFFAETKIPASSDADPVKFATMLNDAVRKYGLEDRLILQSFDYRTIDALHRINPRIRTCLLGAPKRTQDYLALLRQHNATCITLSHKDIDRDGVRQLQDAGILVFSGVDDTAEDWRKNVDLGMDSLFTNEPEGLIAFLEQSGLRARKN